MARFFQLVVGCAGDNFCLKERQRIIIDCGAERAGRINIAFNRDNVGRINRCGSIGFHRPLYGILIDVRYDQLRTFLVQILAQGKGYIADTLYCHCSAFQ
ncbi:hypothetical protein D3C73_1489640 [compost metagenome]